MIYKVSDLIKKYGSRTVLDIAHLEIEKEQIYALLGANGAVKTTLLNILGLLETPTAGQIQYRYRPVNYSESALQALRKEIVLVSQHPISWKRQIIYLSGVIEIQFWYQKLAKRLFLSMLCHSCQRR